MRVGEQQSDEWSQSALEPLAQIPNPSLYPGPQLGALYTGCGEAGWGLAMVNVEMEWMRRTVPVDMAACHVNHRIEHRSRHGMGCYRRVDEVQGLLVFERERSGCFGSNRLNRWCVWHVS